MREHDARQLLELVRQDFPETSATPPPIWGGAPPVRVIDCVLSLNRNYKSVVEPRVNAFSVRHPDIKTCDSLRRMILASVSPGTFLREYLDTRDPSRANTLLGVTEFAIDAQRAFAGDTEEARLRAWADDARPGDYLAVGVRGFAVAGFQYLRLLFGANTCKPDRHIIGYVAKAVGRKVSDVEALYAIERAAKIGGFSAAWLDHEIWKRATSH